MATSEDSTAEASSQQDCFQQLADGAPVMIWMSGLDMGCFYFNRAWLDFRRRTLQEESGNGWAEGVHPDDLERCVNHYVGCFERRMAFAMTYRLRRHTGAYHWILDRGVPHFMPDGTFLGFFGGCAEIDTDAQLQRHVELGGSLTAMREFAREVAAGEVASLHSVAKLSDASLVTKARRLHDRFAERTSELKHAAGELEQLAADMAAYSSIGAAACLP